MQRGDISHCTAENIQGKRKGKILSNQQQASQLKTQTREPTTEMIILAKVYCQYISMYSIYFLLVMAQRR